MNIEEVSFQIILFGGDAKSHAMEAIFHAKDGNFEAAETSLEAASASLNQAHKHQTALIQGEANGDTPEIRILLIHAQDHLMNAITVHDLAKEIVDIHRKLV